MSKTRGPWSVGWNHMAQNWSLFYQGKPTMTVLAWGAEVSALEMEADRLNATDAE